MARQDKRFAIVCGGGPAPGMNGVISSACLRAFDLGYDIVGLYDGFESVCREDFEVDERPGVAFQQAAAKLIGRREMTSLHWEGGTLLRTSRKRPTDEELPLVAANLEKAKIGCLITIGGDDTCQTAQRIAKQTDGRIRVAHIPKTIDNDLPLPHGMPTFGYETARHHGTKLVDHLQRDAKATGRWFIVSIMGASAGHLALGVTKSSRASLCVIPEEFDPNVELGLDDILDIITGAMLKRSVIHGRHDGVAIIAEGLIYKLKDIQERLGKTEHGKVKLSDVDLSRVVVDALKERHGSSLSINGGAKLTRGFVPNNLGYELRCAAPIPFDVEYTCTLGHTAVNHLHDGGDSCLMALDMGKATPLELNALMDADGNTVIREVDIKSESYAVGRNYMIRLEERDFEDAEQIARYTEACNESEEAFRQRFDRMLEIQAER